MMSTTSSSPAPSSNTTATTMDDVEGVGNSSAKSVDDLLASKLNKMTIEERSDGLHDLHGVADYSDIEHDTPEMLDEKLQEMDRILVSRLMVAAAQEEAEMNSVLSDATARMEASPSDGVDSSSSSSNDDDLKAYRIAIAASPITSSTKQNYMKSIKILCLRAECYQSQAAVDLLLRFFTRKMELFGTDCLGRDINPSLDFDEEDKETLRSGGFQLLPYRDRAGRAIAWMHGKVAQNHATPSAARIYFYMVMVALQDEETQKRGVVGIYYGVGQTVTVPGRAAENWKSFKALPWRIVAFHYCVDNAQLHKNPLFWLGNAFQNKVVGRFRLHAGSDTECIYTLLTFGIPQEAIPVSPNGSVDLSSHSTILKMIESRDNRIHNRKVYNNNQRGQAKATVAVADSSSSSVRNSIAQPLEYKSSVTASLSIPPTSSPEAVSIKGHNYHQHHAEDGVDQTLILIPGPMDVLMGMGNNHNASYKKSRRNPGLLRLHCICDEYYEEYESASRPEKTRIAQKIVEEMKQFGCRFLTPAESDNLSDIGGGYVECDDAAVREKVAHRFRNLRQASKRAQQKHSQSNNNGNSNGQKHKISTTNDNTNNLAVNVDGGSGRKRNKQSSPNGGNDEQAVFGRGFQATYMM